jgi:hypothetical protein
MNQGSINCLSIGTRLAEFEIKGVIGEGGFGIVYLCFDHSLQRDVAVKEYMPAALAARNDDHNVIVRSKRHGEAFEAGLRSFINEARLLAQFDHPALVKVYRFWEQHGTAYMAMRYYEGQTFKNVVKETPDVVDEAWLKQILKPILKALRVLYKANVLHRDISPENIMIQSNGQAVLLDFGAARQIVSDLAQSLTVILKPGFAPVEQYADDESMKQGPWTDIYSLSAVVYSAIARKAPPAAVARMLNDPIELLQDGDYPGFSKAFLAAIDRGMAVRPEQRPQTITEFAQLLDIDSGGRSSLRPLPRVVAQKVAAVAVPAPARRGWLYGVGAIGLLVAGVVWFSGQSGTAPVVAVAESAPAPSALPAPVAAADAATPAVSEAPVAAADNAEAPPPATTSAAPVAPAAATPAVADAAKSAVADPAAAKPNGTVSLAVLPWANVYVDGVQRGVSPPLKKLSLPEGSHQIKIQNPNFPEYVVRVTVDARKAISVSRDFSSPQP